MVINTHTNKNQFYTTKLLTLISMNFWVYLLYCRVNNFKFGLIRKKACVDRLFLWGNFSKLEIPGHSRNNGE